MKKNVKNFKMTAMALSMVSIMALVGCGSNADSSNAPAEDTTASNNQTESNTQTEAPAANQIVNGTYVAYEYTTNEVTLKDGRGSDTDFLVNDQTVPVFQPEVTVVEVTFENDEVTGTKYLTYSGETYYSEKKNMLVTRMTKEPVSVGDTGSEDLKNKAIENAKSGVVMSVLPSDVFHSNSGETIPVLSGKISADGKISNLNLEVLSFSYLDENGKIYAPQFIGEDGKAIEDTREFSNRMETYEWTPYSENLNTLVKYVEDKGWDGSLDTSDITTLYGNVFGVKAEDIDVATSASAPKDAPTSWPGQSLVQNLYLFETMYGYFK